MDRTTGLGWIFVADMPSFEAQSASKCTVYAGPCAPRSLTSLYQGGTALLWRFLDFLTQPCGR